MAPTASKPSENVPYFTPAQEPPAGTPFTPAEAPTLFTPLTIRGVTLNHRITVSPMCTYSAEDGHLTDWHLVHLGQFALHGASLVTVEATAVQPRGRISPEDSGLWADSQIAPLRKITDYIHSQGQKSAIQLAHAGRKASTMAPWIGGTKYKALAGVEAGGWPDDTVAPSSVPYDEGWPVPREMSKEEIGELVRDFADAATRALKAGFDVIEIHGAHGYLIGQFLSPHTNKRTDEYGGSFENRTRLLIEVTNAVRAVIPEAMPLFLRVSSTEWLEHLDTPSWTIPDTIRLAKLLPDLGIDLLDVSSGGNSPRQRIPPVASSEHSHVGLNPYYQVDIAGRVREAVRKDGKQVLIGAVGMITNAEMARSMVQEGKLVSNDQCEGTVEVDVSEGGTTRADIVIVARQFLREPNWVLRVAHELGVDVKVANQYMRAPRRRTRG